MLGLRRFNWGEIAALVTVGVVAFVYFSRGGEMFSPGALNAQGRAPLGGVGSHAQLGGNCAACHAPAWSSETMADRCMNCHTDVRCQLNAKQPLHGTLSAGTECRNCHTEHQGPHGVLTNMTKFDHDCAAFKLTGAHRKVDCKSCHVNSLYKGTAQTCVSCHAEPQVHLGRFGTGCASCHSTTTWADATLTTAGMGNFNHDLTGFKLTGKHTAVECKSCHQNSDNVLVFKGTSKACVSCHAEPLVPTVHKYRYGSNCESCHTTTAFKGATFTHTIFSINHGRRNNTCATCHQDLNNLVLYTCYDCHEHTPAKEERRHARPNIAKTLAARQIALDNCIECHGRGKSRRAAEATDMSGLVQANSSIRDAIHSQISIGELILSIGSRPETSNCTGNAGLPHAQIRN
jgi:hypothetical protein